MLKYISELRFLQDVGVPYLPEGGGAGVLGERGQVGKSFDTGSWGRGRSSAQGGLE